jgi:hypothetical protein
VILSEDLFMKMKLKSLMIKKLKAYLVGIIQKVFANEASLASSFIPV